MSDMTTDLAAVRQAAEQMANEWHNPSDCELISNYILATIPERPGDEITADWLRECWGFYSPIDGAWRHGNLTGTFCFEDDGLSWWHVGNRTANITTRHQFAQLMAALGIEPKKGEGV